ncbi:MAG TPA: cupin domain-containing protein, partial [Acidobacteriaceae bacterium]|nr:cupin domain-containing protein [Acidobacteriaceae bacterium]
VNLDAAFGKLQEYFSPKVVGRVNDQYVKVTKLKGEFPWHTHEHEDEMFLVVRGRLTIGRSEQDGGPVVLEPGEFFIVPRGMRHNTSATEETWNILIEPVTTTHSGDVQSPLTKSIAEQLA